MCQGVRKVIFCQSSDSDLPVFVAHLETHWRNIYTVKSDHHHRHRRRRRRRRRRLRLRLRRRIY